MSTSSRRTQSVNDRIRRLAAAQGQDANRVRRTLIFQRLIARLAPAGFILKGGFCLEVRLPATARSTRDVDFVGQLALVADPAELRDELDDLLAAAGFDDGFTFEVGAATRLRGDDVEANAWRISVAALLDGTRFEQVKLDLVGQVQEVMGATEQLVVPLPVQVDGAGPVTIEAVDVYQHAAEKFHAFARLYAHDRPSSRVKDLVDLVLLVETDLLHDVARLKQRLDVVYRERDATVPAAALPEPPANWQRPYEALVDELGLNAKTLATAYELITQTYATALTEGTDL